MDRYIPIEKKSKKEQKKFHDMQRRTWNGLNPVTRTVPNGKGYDRNKVKDNDRKNGRNFRDETTCCFFDAPASGTGELLAGAMPQYPEPENL